MWGMTGRLGYCSVSWNRCLHFWQLWPRQMIWKDPWSGSDPIVRNVTSLLLTFSLLMAFTLGDAPHHTARDGGHDPKKETKFSTLTNALRSCTSR